MKPQPRITVSLPCYERPMRTRRAIESVMQQKACSGVELLVTVDGSKKTYVDIVDWFIVRPMRISDEMGDWINCCYDYIGGGCMNAKVNHECWLKINNVPHTGFWGTAIRNRHIQEATGKYFIFMGSDDILLPNHIENYLSHIEGTDLDFVAFDSWVEPYNAPRNTQFQEGMIGHSELIVRTEFLKTMPPHLPAYGHDWTLVKNMMAATTKYKKAIGAPQTYIVKSVKGNEEKNID